MQPVLFIVIVFNLESMSAEKKNSTTRTNDFESIFSTSRDDDFFVVPPLMLLLKAKHDRFLLDEKAIDQQYTKK